MTDEHGRLLAAAQDDADAVGAGSSVISVDRRLVVAAAGEVEGLDRVAGSLELPVTGSQHQAPPKAPWTRTKRASQRG